LLRFDGYYILADIMEIPNMRQKASKILQQMMSKYCLGLDVPEDPFLPQRNHGFFALYTIAAVMYRWFVFFSILFFLNKVFEPYGLKVIGQIIALMGLVGLIVQPLWAAGKFFHMPGRMDQVKWPRVYATVGIVAAVLAGILLIPFPQNVTCSLQVQALKSQPVYVDVPGRLDEILVAPGDSVEEGDVIAQLSSPEVQLEVDRLAAEVKQYKSRIETLSRQRHDDPAAAAAMLEAEAMHNAKLRDLAKRQEDLDRLKVRAPASGILLAPMTVPSRPTPQDQLPRWSGSPFDPRNRGMYVEVSTEMALCEIGDPQQMEAVLAIDQADIEFVKIGDDVRIKLESMPWKTFESEVAEISRRDMRVAPTSLANQAGGALATTTDQATGAQKPISTTYQASVPLGDADGKLRIGMRGEAKIRVGTNTIFGRLWRYLQHTINFDL
jgi:putative peptide zinc metalloprotease protein